MSLDVLRSVVHLHFVFQIKIIIKMRR
uniref:Uncharacterized protein n=1 Tax=Anguilla anguilla TaxID=7936 RepID=A0A0E9QIV4_ANGAN